MSPVDWVVAGILAMFAGGAFRERDWQYVVVFLCCIAYLFWRSYGK